MGTHQGPTPHSLREAPGPLRQWPPPGWTVETLEQHRDHWRTTRAFLLACTPDPVHANRLLEAAARVDAERRALTATRDALASRARELTEFVRTLTQHVLAPPSLPAADTTPDPLEEAV